MKRIFSLGLIAAFGSPLYAQAIHVRGRVADGAGRPVADAVVELVRQGLRDTTGPDGAYSILKSGVSNQPSGTLREDLRLDDGILEFTVGKTSSLRMEVFDVKGELRNKESLSGMQPGVYRMEIAPALPTDELLIVKASIGAFVRTFRYLPFREGILEGRSAIAGTGTASGMLLKIAAAVDTLKVSAVGYSHRKIGLDSFDSTVNITLDSDATAVYKPCPTNGSPCKILPFGDSITEGVGSSDGAGYRSQLFKLIVTANQKAAFVGSLTKGPTTVSGAAFPRSHEGHAGWTIAPGTSEFGYGGIASLVPSPALNGAPHIILLHIGANDVFPAGRENMASRLEALVEKILQNAPNALLVIAQHTPIGTSNRGHTQAQVDAANAAQRTYNSKIPALIQAQVAKGRHVIGVDMSKMPLSGLTTSSMHPNNQGYAYMADIWYAGIKDLLPK